MNQDPANIQPQGPMDSTPSSAPEPPAAVPTPHDKITAAQSVYPDPDRYREAAALARDMPAAQAPAAPSSAHIWTLVLGALSAASYLALLYSTKSFWISTIVSVAMAGASIYFSVVHFRATREMNPGMVIGLAASTVALLNAVTYLIALSGFTSYLFGLSSY